LFTLNPEGEPARKMTEGAFQMEHFFICPYCGEQISMVVDHSVRHQTYVEDCEVCCNPIEISCTVQDNAIASFNAKTL
jgi:transcription elongation factor Elf1